MPEQPHEQISRRKARENAFIALFSLSFGESADEWIAAATEPGAEYPLDVYGEKLVRAYVAHSGEVDAMIEQHLRDWRAARLPRVNLAILRLAVTEMLFVGGDIESVAINEAVELAKKYADEGDFQFVNGVLGAISRGGHAGQPQDGPAEGEAVTKAEKEPG